METDNVALSELDKPLTFCEASELLGIAYFKVQRAVETGIIPSYSFYNSRRYVKLRDILELMAASKR